MEANQKQVAVAGLIIGLVCGVMLTGIIGGGWYLATRFSSTYSPPPRPQLRRVPPVTQAAPVPVGQSALTPPDAVDAWKQYGPPTTPLGTPPSIPSPYGVLPSRRSLLVAGRIDDIIVSVGGFCRIPTYMLDVNEILDLTSRAWHSGAAYPMRICGQVGTVVENKFFVAGGMDGARNRSEAYLYDPPTDCWQQLASMPYARDAAAAVYGSDGRVYVIGYDGQLKDPHAMQVYDPAANSWMVPAVPAKFGMYASAVAYDDRIFVFGGFAVPANRATDEVFVYDIPNDRWEIAAPMPQPVGCCSVVRWQDRIYVLGGLTAARATTGRVDVYDPQTDSWSRARDISVPRLRMAAVAVDEGIMLLGGSDENSNVFDAAELYVP